VRPHTGSQTHVETHSHPRGPELGPKIARRMHEHAVEAGGAEGLVARLGFRIHSLRGENSGRGLTTAGGKKICGLGWTAAGGTARSHRCVGGGGESLYYVWRVGDQCEILG
jgi:hypothetical protein